MSDSESIEMDDDQTRLAQEENQIKELLKHTSYETLLRLRKEDNQISTFSKKIKKEAMKPKSLTNDASEKSKSKSKPKERDARKPITRFKTILESNKPKTRDPRFDGMSGTLNTELFQKSYGFLIDQKQDEVKALQREIKDATRGKNKNKYSEDDLATLRNALGKNKDEIYRFKQNEVKRDIKKEHKRNVSERVKKGSNPFYMKQSEFKNKIFEKKFDELEGKKKLKKTMEQKKLKQSQKMYREFKKLQSRTQSKNVPRE